MTFLISLFQPRKCLVLVSETGIYNRDEISRYILLLGLHLQLVDDQLPITTPSRYSISISERGFHSHITDRKSTRLNSSHSQISYAVFCLKKKKKTKQVAYSKYITIQYMQLSPDT